MHTAGNNRKSVPAQNISSPRSSLHGSSTGGTRWGPLTTAPGNHPQLLFPSVPNLLCDCLSHNRYHQIPYSKLSISVLLKLSKSKFPISAYFPLQKKIHNLTRISKKKKRSWLPVGGLLNSTLCWTTYTYMGHTQICTKWPLKKVTKCSWPWYTVSSTLHSLRLHRQFIYNSNHNVQI